jgi:4-hydroxybenzoate polyprenyltransferase
VGGWLAVREDLGLPVLALAASVLFWVAGFDILYALQDEEFDRAAGLFSLPCRRGTRQARRAAALCHFLSAAGFILTGRLADLGGVYMAAAMFSAIILASEHILMARRGTVNLPPAFFTLNSLVSMGLGLATLVSLAF